MTIPDIPRVTLRPDPGASTMRQPLARALAPVQSLLAGVLTGSARLLEGAARAAANGADRIADLGAAATPAPLPPIALAGAPGAELVHDLLITNPRASVLRGAVSSTDWYGDDDTLDADRVVRFEPAVVDIRANGLQPVRAHLTVPSKLPVGATYRATFFVSGSPDFRQPVVLHVGAARASAAARGRRVEKSSRKNR